MSENVSPDNVLTPRELDVLKLLAKEYTNREIAEKLVLSPGTIKWYNKQIYNKLVVNSRQEAVSVAREKGILGGERTPTCPNNLPSSVNLFIGREKEKQALTALINKPNTRLITILGAGGMGKTHLALEVGRHLIAYPNNDAFNDGIYFVNLAPANDTTDTISAIADAVNFRFYADNRNPKQQILDYLRPKNQLLILDNFEHLMDSATLIMEILKEAAALKILVTSRERLNLSGETTLRLAGMEYPTDETIQEPLAFSAVQLFVQSAKKVRHDFTLDQKEVPHLVRICHLLQGLPLGIILAASWVEVLALSEIDHQITQNIDILTSQQRDLPKRLRSIRAVFDHSLKMMDQEETNLFLKLCVFRGGFTAEAGKAVAGAELHNLINLSHKSLIQYDAEKKRYYIHELLRQYAAQQLKTQGQWETVCLRHAEYFAQLAELAEPELRLANQEHFFQTLTTEYDNLRAAMAWSFADKNIDPGLQITAVLRDFWFYEGYHIEGQKWCERALKYVDDNNPLLRGKLNLTLGLLLWARHEMEACWQSWKEAISNFKKAGDHRLKAWSLGMLGGSKWGDDLTGYENDIERIETAINTLRQLDDKPGEAQLLNILGNVHRNAQNLDKARSAYEACLQIVRQTGEKRRECIILSNLALVAYSDHDYKKAKSISIRGLKNGQEIGFDMLLTSCLHTFAGALTAIGQPSEAAKFLGAVAAYQQHQGISFAPNDQHFHDKIQDDVRQDLDESTFQKAWNQGLQMPIYQAVRLALDPRFR